MTSKTTKLVFALAAAGVIGTTLAYSPLSQAFDFGNMMNPSKWMGGGDRYDDDYYGGPYGGGPYGGGPYGGGPYGGGPYGGYGPGPSGYGAPGYYGSPGYRGAPPPAAAPAPRASTPSSAPKSRGESREIEALKRRIDELESQQQQSAPPPASDWGSAPAFRPMGKY